MKRKKVFVWILSAIAIITLCLILGVPIDILGVIFLGVLVVGFVWYICFGQEYSEVIQLTMLSSAVVAFGAFLVAFEKPIPISVLQFWLLIELGLVASIITLSLFLVGDDYVISKRRLNQLEDYAHRTENLEKELREKNRLIEAMSVSDLLALKDKHKSDESVVEIIDDILEERE